MEENKLTYQELEQSLLNLQKEFDTLKNLENENHFDIAKHIPETHTEDINQMIIYTIDREYNYVYFNKAYKKIIKKLFNADIALGLNVFNFMSSEDEKEKLKNIYDHVFEGRSHAEIQRYGNHNYTFLESFFNPVLNKNKDIVGLSVFAVNITDHKQIEIELTEKQGQLESKNEEILTINVELNDRNNEYSALNEEYKAQNDELIVAKERTEESEAKFRSYFVNALDGIFIVDECGNYIEVNPAASQITGYSEAELCNMNLLQLYDESMEQLAINHFTQLNQNGKSTGELPFIKKDKTIGYWIVSAVKLSETRFLGFAKDITDRKLAEKDLQEREFFFRESQRAAYIGSYKTNFITGYWESSPVMDEIFGIDKNYIRSIEGWVNIVHPEEQQKLADYLTTEVIGKKQRFDYSYRIVRINDKETRWVQGYGDLTFDENGGVTYMIGTIQDITERKELEIQLREAKTLAEESFYFLQESQKAGQIGSYTADYTIDRWESSKILDEIFGIDKDFVHNNQAWLDLVHPDEREELNNYYLNDILKLKKPFNKEYRIIRHNDKQVRWVQGFGDLKFDNQGNVIGMIGTIQDVTDRKLITEELKRAKEMVEESDRLKTAFLQNMSHEIGTPMNAIVGFSDMLNKPNLSDEKRKSFITIIQNSSKQLFSIVSDVLTISSLETKQESIHIQNVSVNDLILDLLTIFKAQASNQNVSIFAKQDLKDNEAQISTDKTKLTQIITNLITNALKFTHEGAIEFGYTLKNNELEFYVKDSGIGIDQSMQDKIFDRFRQADISINKKYGGTGLGLAISKAFVELLGGKIWVESALGKGATFYFTIPYEVNISSEMTELGKIIPTQTILVAEDDEYNYLFIEELLIDYKFKIIHAKDGQEAVDYCISNPDICLVLMDIKMPIMDGFEATNIIRKHFPKLPIIAQTAYALENEIEKFRQKGFDEYVSKPIKEDVLKRKIAKHISLY